MSFPRTVAAAASAVALAVLAFSLALSQRPGRSAPAGAQPAHSLQLLSPGPTSLATHNQAAKPEAYTAAISDQAMAVPAGVVTFRGSAKGMRNVAIVAAGSWNMVEPDGEGTFAKAVDLSPFGKGPLVVDVYAWDTPPNSGRYTVALNLRVLLFVEGAESRNPPVARPQGHPAHGKTLVWSEEFDGSLQQSWHAGSKPDGQQYGAAVFAAYGNPVHDPYTVKDGFLRIRSKHVPDLVDPNGWGRKWITGQLSTGFPDGSAKAAFRKGYFEARMLLPAGPGCWPSFWLLDQSGIKRSESDGAVEIDVVEGYGHDTDSYVATQHDWPPPSAKGAGYRRSQRNIEGLPDYSWSFHDFGAEITDSEVVFYFDGVEKFRAPLYRASTISPFFLLIVLAMSHDWPITVPPSGYYDLWIDHVRIYQ